MSRRAHRHLNRRDLIHLATGTGLGMWTGCLGAAAARGAIEPTGENNMIDGLSGEQSAHAEQMLALMETRQQFFLDTIERFNGNFETETRVFDEDKALHEVSVARGEVIEKAGWYTNRNKTADPPYVPEMIWGQYFEMDFHPRTPLLGQMHATVYFAYLTDGTSAIAGYMDYTPATWIDEDVAYMKAAVDQVMEENGHDAERFRQMLYKDYHKDKLRAACIGAAFYVRPMLKIDAKNFAFVTDAHTRFVNAYLDVLDRRKDQPFTDRDIENQAGMRRRWLEDHLFSDPFTMNVVPYEVWSFADAPPIVHF
ncbi:MAG: coproporphyrinogen III oxidase [Gammaproteobacteria bacterium]